MTDGIGKTSTGGSSNAPVPLSQPKVTSRQIMDGGAAIPDVAHKNRRPTVKGLLRPDANFAVSGSLNYIAAMIEHKLNDVVKYGQDPYFAAQQIGRWVAPVKSAISGLKRQTLAIINLKQGAAASGLKSTLITETQAMHSKGQINYSIAHNQFVIYAVSPLHPRADACDDYADRDNGWGKGVYLATHAPIPPMHRGCKCMLLRFNESICRG